MFTTPICQDIYNALLSRLKGTGKLFLLVRKGRFADVDLRAEDELAEQLTQEGHETCELPEFLNRADGTPVAFSLNVDIVTAISKYGYDRARIRKVPVREIMEENWFSTYSTTTTAFRDVQVARALGLRYPRQPIDYIILFEDPLWGHLTLIDGNHKLAEACIDKKDAVRILTLTRDEGMECLLPESQKLASLVASTLTRIGAT